MKTDPVLKWLYFGSPRAVVLFGLPQVVLLIAAGWAGGHRPETIPLWLLGGLGYWTLIEYVMHRYVLHWRPRREAIRRIMSAAHELHHLRPTDTEILNVGPLISLPLTAVIYLLTAAVLRSWSSSALLMAGAMLGFFAYEYIHHRVHTRADRRSVFAPLHRSHATHHFINERRNFGVTSPFWDRVFGTYQLAGYSVKKGSAAP